MTDENLMQQIVLFKSLFKGRDDVFAIRWEKGGKSGYMPSYQYDPYIYRLHKMKGGTFQNFNDKSYLPYSDEQIAKHLQGDQLMEIYPLLKDNTSWFIAADFDDAGWENECKVFVNSCSKVNIPAYLERSRSGKGGHVWIFFDQPYPAVKSRKIVISLLVKLGIFSVFDKSSSFDRLFPNQETLSGKGFGNLIALPFYKPTWEQGNSCFVDIETLRPIGDQWKFLKNIKRISGQDLDKLYYRSEITTDQVPVQVQSEQNSSCKLFIRLNNSVKISRMHLPISLISFLKDEFNFLNTEFIVKKKMGKNTWGTAHYFKCVEETDSDVIIPRGSIGKLVRFCRGNKIEFEFKDERKKLDLVPFTCDIHLRDYQKPAIEAAGRKDIGVIVAPPGTGKTVIALKIIAEKQQPTLIVVHRKQLAEQWIERIQTFLGIPKNEIGRIEKGKSKPGKKITIALIQSLSKELEKPDNLLQKAFGTIIFDECHHIPAETFRRTISQLSTYYLYGFTATPFRKYNDAKLIFFHLGEVISELKTNEVSTYKRAFVNIRNTELDVPFNSKTDRFETLSNVLVHDSARNKLIINDLVLELAAGKKVVILTERKEHIETINQYLKQRYETVTLSGEDSESSRNMKWKILKEGSYQVLITTGQYFGEGTDLQQAECLFLVYPFSFEGKLIQYIGRVQRSEVSPTIYDYRDYKIDYLNKLFLKRNTYYRRLEKQATLFDEQQIEPTETEKNYIFEQQIKLSLEQIEFMYGSFVFRFVIKEINKELEFEIENDDIRPEFEVLKPYFSKILSLKQVKIDLFAEFINEKLISQMAQSSDLEKFNREIIESVKFKFVTKTFFGKVPISKFQKNLLDITQLQIGENGNIQLFDSNEEFLENILKNKSFRHYRQIRYLANNHTNSILKIRFVLSPFSFVFLLSGAEQFHIVMETLDTEEATYIWQIHKDLTLLRNKLKEIDLDINIIRNDGRQTFLESQPQDFTRIVHDYSDERKGFVIWKDLLEEILV
ncbi:MAG TPA: DEAD/DEAH box helicase family protein [Prolixibacteraceae bacterium]|nr:DEAD/DEAH box helicase family protein [Prolixibacteraceae bacterium]